MISIDLLAVFLFSGVAFYSISDVAERLLSTSSRPIPCLEDNYWLSQRSVDSPDLVQLLLEELSPAAMAAFDLSCCQCTLWKTSRQLLETAERRLSSFLEARGESASSNCIWAIFIAESWLILPTAGMRVDSKVLHTSDIRGFPSVLQQISKVLNRTSTSKGTSKIIIIYIFWHLHAHLYFCFTLHNLFILTSFYSRL